jgi:hypothetical protein
MHAAVQPALLSGILDLFMSCTAVAFVELFNALENHLVFLLLPLTDPTMTLTNLTRLLGSVENWSRFCAWLHIRDQVHDVQADRVKSSCEWYLANHPAPSWLHVARALYYAREHNVLFLLTNRFGYLSGGFSVNFMTAIFRIDIN